MTDGMLSKTALGDPVTIVLRVVVFFRTEAEGERVEAEVEEAENQGNKILEQNK